MGMANCGILNMLACGNVKFHVHFHDGGTRTVVMHDCMHAPDVPINLILVGYLQEQLFHILFHPTGTDIYFSAKPGQSPLVVEATLLHCLSFLNIEIVLCLTLVAPDTLSSPLPISHISHAIPSPSFIPFSKSLELWYCHLGHPGMDSTRHIITKDFIDGINFTDPTPHIHCVSCILEKQLQLSYPSHPTQANQSGELLHMDFAGPFPIHSPRGKAYFLSICDCHSHWGFAFPLTRKNQAFSHYLTVEAST